MKASDWLSLLLLSALPLFSIFCPFPSWVIDTLLMLSVGVSFVLFAIAFSVKDNLHFAAFPTLALLFTLFRILVFIACFRIILWTGMAGESPGLVISAFSGFLSKTGLVQCCTVTALLFMIELFIIARVKDKMLLMEKYYFPPASGSPSKINRMKLSIEEEEREKHYYQEANYISALSFTGRVMALDAWLTVLITALAIPIGLSIGKAHGFQPEEALIRITCLCAGICHVILYQALLLALACATVLTRDPYYWSAVGRRPGRASFLLYILAVIFTLIGGIVLLNKGPFMWFPFFIVAGAFVLSARLYPLNPLNTFNDFSGISSLLCRHKRSAEAEEPIPLLSLELGCRHGTWFDRDIFMNCLKPFADDLENDLGYTVPPVTFTEGSFRAGEYIISVTDGRKELIRELWEVVPGHLLAVGPEESIDSIEGTRTHEPAYCLPALWIDESAHRKAEASGFTILEPHAVIARHMAGLIRKVFHWLLTPMEVKARVKALQKKDKASISPFIPKRLSCNDLHIILQDLLKEGLPIGSLAEIIEIMKRNSSCARSGLDCSETARAGLAKMVCLDRIKRDGSLKILTLDRELEKKLLLASTDFAGTMSEELFQAVAVEIKALFLHCLASGIDPLMVVSPPIRSLVRTITAPPPTSPPLFCPVNPVRLTIAAKLADASCPELIIISSADVPKDAPLRVIADLDL
jgi:flagellar biosynthesis protein FlhA